MTHDTDHLPAPQYTAGFLANSFGLTLRQARDIIDRANGSRDLAAEMARKLKHPQP